MRYFFILFIVLSVCLQACCPDIVPLKTETTYRDTSFVVPGGSASAVIDMRRYLRNPRRLTTDITPFDTAQVFTPFDTVIRNGRVAINIGFDTKGRLTAKATAEDTALKAQLPTTTITKIVTTNEMADWEIWLIAFLSVLALPTVIQLVIWILRRFKPIP